MKASPACATQLAEYFRGERVEFDVPVIADGTELQRRVWDLVRQVPYGQTSTYGRLARELGDGTTPQEVGAAVGRNPLCILIPCHRIVSSTGKLTGYAGGLAAQAVPARPRRSGGQPVDAPVLMARRVYTLVGADGSPYRSPIKGTLGGHRRSKIFGRLDCPSALRAIARGGYVRQRVFFVDAATAVCAGYRPCAVCMPDAYRVWRSVGSAVRDHIGDGEQRLDAVADRVVERSERDRHRGPDAVVAQLQPAQIERNSASRSFHRSGEVSTIGPGSWRSSGSTRSIDVQMSS